jgi:hypothetical protein
MLRRSQYPIVVFSRELDRGQIFPANVFGQSWLEGPRGDDLVAESEQPVRQSAPTMITLRSTGQIG